MDVRRLRFRYNLPPPGRARAEGEGEMMNNPAIISPPLGKFTEEEMAEWPQHSGVRRVMLSGFEYEDQYMLMRSLHSVDARNHFVNGYRWSESRAETLLRRRRWETAMGLSGRARWHRGRPLRG